MSNPWKAVTVHLLVRESDEQELVDGLIEFVENDPWSVATDLERRELTQHDVANWQPFMGEES